MYNMSGLNRKGPKYAPMKIADKYKNERWKSQYNVDTISECNIKFNQGDKRSSGDIVYIPYGELEIYTFSAPALSMCASTPKPDP